MKVVDNDGNVIEKARCTVRDPSGMRYSITSNPEAVVIQRGIDCKNRL